MRKSKRPTVGRNKPRLTTSWKTKMKVVDAPSKIVDLSSGASDDSWDDCLDELDDDPSSAKSQSTDHDDDNDDGLNDFFDGKDASPTAIHRIQAMSKANIYGTVGKPKKMGKQRTGSVARLSGKSKPKVKSVKIVKAAPTIGPRSTPEPNDKALRRLWRCRTLDEVKQEHLVWNGLTRGKCEKALDRRKIQDSARTIITSILDGVATNVPVLTSHKALTLSWETVQRLIVSGNKDNPDIEYALVTFIEGVGGTSSDAPFIELCHSRDRVVRVTRSMAKDFIGVTELAMFNSHGHPDGGRHIQRHEHVLIWGHGIVSKAQQVAQRRMQEFSPNITGAPQIDVRRVSADEVNLARICAYLFKSPHKCMNWNPPSDGKNGHMNQSEKGDRMIRYLRMAQIRSMMTVEDVVFAGGAGVGVRGQLFKLLRETFNADVPTPNRLLHPDAIGSFWVEANKELRRPDWKLPVIARRP